MAEQSFLAGVFSSLTPGGAVMFGLVIGAAASIFSRLVGLPGLLRGGQVQSLHMEMHTTDQPDREVRKSRNSNRQRVPVQDTQEQELFVRRWRVEEVAIDESLGIS
jgi:hypothetical protein